MISSPASLASRLLEAIIAWAPNDAGAPAARRHPAGKVGRTRGATSGAGAALGRQAATATRQATIARVARRGVTRVTPSGALGRDRRASTRSPPDVGLRRARNGR